MTATLVRPAPGLARFGTVTPVRVRPAPSTDPPYDGFPDDLPEPLPASPPAARVPAPQPSGDAYRAIRRYLDLTLEVLGGFRPIWHLRGLTEPARFDEVAGQLVRLGGPSVTRPGSGLARVGADRTRLRQLRICEVREGAAEAAAVLARGEEVRAMTLRVERGPGGWLCTHLRVL
jgi:hypothetical protein